MASKRELRNVTLTELIDGQKVSLRLLLLVAMLVLISDGFDHATFGLPGP